MNAEPNATPLVFCRDLPAGMLARLFARFDLALHQVGEGEPIPGTYWGEPEAGILGPEIYVRGDTPLHSALHEGCHLICADAGRRAHVKADIGGDYAEENGVCYLQLLLADELEEVGVARLAADMDSWGYTFRLGSTMAWFEQDAADARAWLEAEGLVDSLGKPTWRLRC